VAREEGTSCENGGTMAEFGWMSITVAGAEAGFGCNIVDL